MLQGLELKSLNLKKTKTNNSCAIKNNENIILPEGCTIGGDPLQVSFLSIEKLESLSKVNLKYDYADFIEYDSFETHLISSNEALELMNE